MESLYIYHHLGLGDAFLCNGIVRTYADKYPFIFVFAKPHNAKNVSHMYRDLKNLKVIALDDAGVKFFMMMNPEIKGISKYLIVGITSEWFNNFNSGKYESFDHGFYVAANVPFEDKWNKFYLRRDFESEKNTFYKLLGLKDGEEYLFVHDDQERGRFFKPEYINKGLRVIRPTDFKNIGIFDFIYIIEHAKEVHVMNSSFSCLIDTMQIYNDNLYYHEYARTDMGDNPNHKFKMKWNLIK